MGKQTHAPQVLSLRQNPRGRNLEELGEGFLIVQQGSLSCDGPDAQ